MRNIKFRKHFVTDGNIKARILYHLDCRVDGRKCVTLYAKDWTRDLGKIFSSNYKNETDSMTDYFDQGHVCFFEDHDLHADARKAAESYLKAP
jgi:hypothetical protein